MSLLLLLIACGTVRDGGGTAVGNPGRASLRLAPEGASPFDVATAEARFTLSGCEGDDFVFAASVDLVRDPPIEVPAGLWCGLEVSLTDLFASGVEPLQVAAATAVIPLTGFDFDHGDWVIELGVPGRFDTIATESGLYAEVLVDGSLDAFERSLGAVAAGAARPVDAPEADVVVAVGESGLRSPLFAEAVDYSQSEGEALIDVAYAEGRWVAVGGEAFGRVDVSSEQGVVWESAELPMSAGAVEFVDGWFYAAAFGGAIYRSVDALTWGSVASETVVWQAIGGGDRGVVAVGDGAVGFSPDGVDWTRVDLPGAPSLWGVAEGSPGFVAVGLEGTRWFSADGEAWVETDSGGAKLQSVVWTGTRFVAVGDDESWTSVDGQSWAPGPLKTLGDVARDGDALVAVSDRFVYRSVDDGDSWVLWREVDGFLLGVAANRP